MDKKFLIGIIVATIAIFGVGIYFVTRPAPVISTEEMVLGSTAVKGPQEYKALLVEFSDFQCPACKAYKPVVDQLITNNHGLKLAYRHFPLPQHPFGLKAAYASEAAKNQSKFWEMYDYLFANQEVLSDAIINDAWKALELDEQQYKQDLNSEDIKQSVQKDVSDGSRFKVNSTPTFFLNGVKLNISSPAQLEQAILEVL